MFNFSQATQELNTIIDFMRFGLTMANKANLFYGHGTDNAWDDINSLILRSLDLPYDVNINLLNSQLTRSEKELLSQQLERRINQRIPVPYLIHEAYFCNLPFYVDERVIIPRSPIAELINNYFTPWVSPQNVHNILDLCTGSGCIAIACCEAFPHALVDAVDVSSSALEVAAINQKKFQVAAQLTLIESDCFSNIPLNKRYDLIISNPPYVNIKDMQTLPQEYSYEPILALEADNNGLAVVEKILGLANDYLSENGILVVEVGAAEDILSKAYPLIPFTWLELEHGGQGVFILTKQQLESIL